MDDGRDRFAERRARMVDTQLRLRDIDDPRVLEAMGSVPREAFVPERLHAEVYADGALPIGEGQTISQPYMVAATCQAARLKGDERVLEVGLGSGYQAAVLAHLAKEVVGIERIEPLAEKARRNLEAAGVTNVEVVVGDGSRGYPPRAPYGAIIVAAGAPNVPRSLVDQLDLGGRLIIPVGRRDFQRLTIVEKLPDGRLREIPGPACVFVPLVGDEGWRDG